MAVQLDGTSIPLILRTGIELRMPIGLIPTFRWTRTWETVADVRITDDGPRMPGEERGV